MRIGALILDERQIQFGGAVGATKNEHADREALRHVLKPLDHGDMVQCRATIKVRRQRQSG